jgi:hypothetical protein
MEYQFVATAAFQVPKALGTQLSLLVYGFLFHRPQNFPEFCAVLPESIRSRLPVELYYAGWAKLTFTGVQGGEIEVNPYQPRFPPGDRLLMTDSNGTFTRLDRIWPPTDTSEGFEYILECSLEQPFGAMRLAIRAAGAVELSVNPEEFMMAEDAYGHPEFAHDETRSRQLRTIEEMSPSAGRAAWSRTPSAGKAGSATGWERLREDQE